MKTKGEIEAEITRAIVQFEIDYMGRGPKAARTRIIEDMVLIRLTGVLTPAEQQLTKSADGGELVKKMRSTLIEKAKPFLYQVVSDITGAKIIDLYTDIRTASGERVFVFSLEHDLEAQLQRQKGALLSYLEILYTPQSDDGPKGCGLEKCNQSGNGPTLETLGFWSVFFWSKPALQIRRARKWKNGNLFFGSSVAVWPFFFFLCYWNP